MSSIGPIGPVTGVPTSQIDYVQTTVGDTAITATSGSAADTVITGVVVPYDGATKIKAEFYCVQGAAAVGNFIMLLVDLVAPGAVLGGIAIINGVAQLPIAGSKVFTPVAGNHQYGIQAFTGSGTAHLYAGDGTGLNACPMYLRITHA